MHLLYDIRPSWGVECGQVRLEWKIYVVMLSGRPTWRTILMFVIARAQFTANHHKTCVYAQPGY